MKKLAGPEGDLQALDELARVIETAGYHPLRQRHFIPRLVLPALFGQTGFHSGDAELFLENLPAESLEAYHFKLMLNVSWLESEACQRD